MTHRLRTLTVALLLSSAAALVGCDTSEGGNEGASGVSSGGGQSGGSDVGGFQLSSISVPANQSWQINRPVTFIFTKPLDFSSISLNSIAIRDSNNFPASGVFSFDPAQPRIVTFQPTCPVRSDFSDAGFLPGGKLYTITVIGKDSASGTSVRSSTGQELEVSQTRVFFTPSSLDLASLFLDPTPGAPQPVIRSEGSTVLGASYVEVAEDSTPARRIYFERDPMTQVISVPGSGVGSIPPGHPNEALATGMPLNLYSNRESRLVFVVEVNQPVNPAPDNINSSRISLQAETSPGSNTFGPVPSTVTLVRNCTSTGATLRVEPIGVLPQNVDIRVVIDAAFEDLVGNKHSADIENFARIQTVNVGVALADEILEEFTVGGSATGSLEDTGAAFAVPRAEWGSNGRLAPRFDFDGNGGPTGAFDYRVRGTGGTVTIDTSFQTVSDANQTLQQTIINGRMDVRNFTIEPGGVLELRGPNPLIINATGKVRIDGMIDMVGFSGKDVSGVFTATFPEPGAPGNMGGGKGGDASTNTSASTPKGDNGNGAFGLTFAGGRGGESGFGADPTAMTNKDIQDSHPRYRRAGGGGGGIFGPNVNYSQLGIVPEPANTIGTIARRGGRGDDTATGALSGNPNPDGGDQAGSPFVDANDDNDFFGVKFDAMTGTLIEGELKRLYAGSGGGGGGDAIRATSFPNPMFSNKTEDKGAAGGGAAGGIWIRALGDVEFGPNGKIVAEGGGGALGQVIQFSGNFFVKSGSSSGAGSGGHVVIESSGTIDLGTGLDVISARGGQGGPGGNKAQGLGTPARGGNGGPGIVQLHTPNGLADIMTTQTIETAVVPIPHILLPNFGATSRARSKWIPLGGAVGDMPDDVTFLFGGTDSTTGFVQDVDMDTMVDDLTEIIGPRTLATSGEPELVGDHTLRFDFVNDPMTMFGAGDLIYRDNPVLMKNFSLVLREVGNVTNQRRYNIETAMVDPNDPDVMILTTTSTGLPFSEFVGQPASVLPSLTSAEFLILPRFFRVVTNGVDGSLPASTSIQILFEGTGRDALGNPEASSILVPLTSDITDLSSPALAKPVEFFRFEVEFNVDAMSNGLKATSPRPVLEFLRIPFKF